MAIVKHARGVKLLLKVGDAASPEVFTALCTINAQRGITFNGSANDFNLPDCDDPDLIGWLAREKVSLSVGATGAGVLNTPDIDTMFDWWKSEDPRNCQIVIDVPAVDGGRVFEGAFHLIDFGITGNRGAKMEATVTLASDGEVTIADNT